MGICLGQAFREALGDKSGITRYGEAVIPMDETLVSAAVDFGGRAAFVYRADALKGRRVGTFDVELGREFFGGFVSTALCNLHLEVRYGENAHHMIEALFKAFARATAAAARLRPARRRACRRPRGRSPREHGRRSSSPTWEAATCAASRRRWPPSGASVVDQRRRRRGRARRQAGRPGPGRVRRLRGRAGPRRRRAAPGGARA